jgi:hypothetical protein
MTAEAAASTRLQRRSKRARARNSLASSCPPIDRDHPSTIPPTYRVDTGALARELQACMIQKRRECQKLAVLGESIMNTAGCYCSSVSVNVGVSSRTDRERNFLCALLPVAVRFPRGCGTRCSLAGVARPSRAGSAVDDVNDRFAQRSHECLRWGAS